MRPAGLEQVQDVLGGEPMEVVDGLARRAGDVRRQDDVGQAGQRVVGRVGRLGDADVERGDARPARPAAPRRARARRCGRRARC